MKIEGIPGTFFAQAFIYEFGKRKLCSCFHSGINEVMAAHDPISRVHVEWPVEIMDGIAYVPSEEEMKDAI